MQYAGEHYSIQYCFFQSSNTASLILQKCFCELIAETEDNVRHTMNNNYKSVCERIRKIPNSKHEKNMKVM